MAKPPKTNQAPDDDLGEVDLSENFEEEARRAPAAQASDDDVSDDDTDDLDDALEDGDDLEDDDQDEGDDDSDDGDDPEDEDEDAGAQDRAARKPQGAKARIQELSRLRREAEEKAFQLELRLQELERAKQAAPAPETPQLPPEPDPRDFDYGEVDAKYLDAVVEYRVAKKAQEDAAARAQETAQQAQARENAKYGKRLDEVMKAGEKAHPGFGELINRVPFDAQVARMVLDSEQAVDIAFHLGNNLGDLRELTLAAPDERARILGRLEGRLSAASAGKKKATGAPNALGRTRKRKPPSKDAEKYGPSDQDAFDKAFFNQR